MQVLKENIRDAILLSARSEFKRSGYSSASMREIARNAGVTPGNLYRYYAGKEELFAAVVQPLVHQLEELADHEHPDELPANTDELLDEGISIFARTLVHYRDEALVLLSEHRGDLSREALVTLYEQHFIDHFKHVGARHGQDGTGVMPRALSEGVIQGLSVILEGVDDDNELFQEIKRYIMYFSAGFIDLLKRLGREQ